MRNWGVCEIIPRSKEQIPPSTPPPQLLIELNFVLKVLNTPFSSLYACTILYLLVGIQQQDSAHTKNSSNEIKTAKHMQL